MENENQSQEVASEISQEVQKEEVITLTRKELDEYFNKAFDGRLSRLQKKEAKAQVEKPVAQEVQKASTDERYETLLKELETERAEKRLAKEQTARLEAQNNQSKLLKQLSFSQEQEDLDILEVLIDKNVVVDEDGTRVWKTKDGRHISLEQGLKEFAKTTGKRFIKSEQKITKLDSKKGSINVQANKMSSSPHPTMQDVFNAMKK